MAAQTTVGSELATGATRLAAAMAAFSEMPPGAAVGPCEQHDDGRSGPGYKAAAGKDRSGETEGCDDA
jgi:hypothetical protein